MYLLSQWMQLLKKLQVLLVRRSLLWHVCFDIPSSKIRSTWPLVFAWLSQIVLSALGTQLCFPAPQPLLCPLQYARLLEPGLWVLLSWKSCEESLDKVILAESCCRGRVMTRQGIRWYGKRTCLAAVQRIAWGLHKISSQHHTIQQAGAAPCGEHEGEMQQGWCCPYQQVGFPERSSPASTCDRGRLLPSFLRSITWFSNLNMTRVGKLPSHFSFYRAIALLFPGEPLELHSTLPTKHCYLLTTVAMFSHLAWHSVAFWSMAGSHGDTAVRILAPHTLRHHCSDLQEE